MGNPHVVLTVADVKTAPVERLGPRIEHHARFPRTAPMWASWRLSIADTSDYACTNGASGETLACGTGACAAVAVGRKRGLLDSEVKVDLPAARR